ncbi:MAG: hypothetical protein LBQ78_05265, partial [Tannerellaceae bacterium]|nr:hypothetical protein [Tannerellaceae bacterium]
TRLPFRSEVSPLAALGRHDVLPLGPPNGIAIAVIFLFDKPGLLGTRNDGYYLIFKRLRFVVIISSKIHFNALTLACKYPRANKIAFVEINFL